MKAPLHILTTVLLAVLAAVFVTSCGDDGTTNTDPGAGGNDQPILGNIVFTNAWMGEWNVTIVFAECASGDTLSIDQILDVICEGDTLDLQLMPDGEDCSGTINDTHLIANCEYQVVEGGCTLDIALTLDIERRGETLVGTGQWSSRTSGSCPSSIDACESLVIAGTRLDTSPADCSAPQPVNVADRFSLTPRLFVRPHLR